MRVGGRGNSQLLKNSAQPPSWAHWIIACWGIVALLGLGTPVGSQTRPVLRQPRQDHLAGRILLLPGSGMARASLEARQTAALLDHALLSAPARGTRHEALDWLEREAARGCEGVILAWEALESGAASEGPSFPERLRMRHPHLPLVAYTESPPGSSLRTSAVKALEQGWIDHLLFVDVAGQSEAGETSPSVPDDQTAVLLLLTRLLLDRFGFVPEILPVYSGRGGAAIRREVTRQIEAIGGKESQGNAAPDLLLFVHLPGTTAEEWAALLSNLERTIDRDVRIALLDLSGSEAGKAELAQSSPSLLTALRERKWIDRLASYASPPPVLRGDSHPSIDAWTTPTGTARTVAAGLSQSTLFVSSLLFLRDEYARLIRVDRAQVALLLARILAHQSIGYRLPGLSAPASRDALVETLRGNLSGEAELLFREQFWRNVHAIRMTTGERVRFEMRLLQRLQVSLTPLANPEPERFEIEIRPSVHTAPLRSFAPRADQSIAVWELTEAKLAPRLARQWANFPWWRMRFDVDQVRLTIRFGGKEGAFLPSEGYRIRNRRRGSTRTIEVFAASEQGASYGLTRLEELGHRGDLMKNGEWSEAPQLAIRGLLDEVGTGWSQRVRLDLLALLGQHRLNLYALVPVGESTESLLDRVPSLLATAQEHFVNLAVAINSPSKTALTSSDRLEWESRLRTLTRLGVDHLLFLANDRAPLSLESPLAETLAQWSTLAPNSVLTIIAKGSVEGEFRALRQRFPSVRLRLADEQAGDLALLRLPSSGTALPCLAAPLPLDPQRLESPPIGGVLIWPATAESPLPYALLPRLAASAAHIWAPSRVSPEDGLANLLAAEAEGASVALQTWIEATKACDAPPEATAAALSNALQALRGSRSWGLLRGELRRALRRTDLPGSPPSPPSLR